MPFVRSDGTRPARKTTRQPDVAGRFIKRVEPRSTSRKTASTHRSHSGAGAPHVPSPATPLRRRPELGLPSKCRSTVTIHSLHGSSPTGREVDERATTVQHYVTRRWSVGKPGGHSSVVGLSSVMTDVSAIHAHTSTPTRSGSGFRLDLDRHGDSGQIGACPGRHGPWAATTLEPWAELRRPSQHEQQQAHR